MNRATLVAVDPVFNVRGLEVAYGPRRVLSGVDLTIHPRRVTALMGPSGCGKSSLLYCLNRLTDLIPHCRVGGRVALYGRDIFEPGTNVLALRRRVGMIFQKPNPFPVSIRKNLELPLRDHGMRDRRRIEAAVEGALKDVGLWDEVKDCLDRPATALSGGQQQRLCLARAIALQPEVLLLDEPCSALDPISGDVVEDRIVRLKERYTIVLVTHNLPQARRIADEVGVFWMRGNCGALIEFGPCRDIFERPREELTAAYVNGSRG